MIDVLDEKPIILKTKNFKLTITEKANKNKLGTVIFHIDASEKTIISEKFSNLLGQQVFKTSFMNQKLICGCVL